MLRANLAEWPRVRSINLTALLAVIAGETRMTERLFLTHRHPDHFDGLGELMVQSSVQGARAASLADSPERAVNPQAFGQSPIPA